MNKFSEEDEESNGDSPSEDVEPEPLIESPDESIGSNLKWLDNYARDTRVKVPFRAESPSRRGMAALERIWARIRPELEKRDVASVPTELPSDVSKWAILPDWLELMERVPHTHRNVFEWLDDAIPKGGMSFRGGCMTVQRKPELSVARAKQSGQGFNDPKPSFTFHGERLPYFKAGEMFEKWIRSARADYPDNEVYDLDLESMEGWNKVLGGRFSTYVGCESTLLFHGMTPHQETHSPIPWDIVRECHDEVLEQQFPGFSDEMTTIDPFHLFVGTAPSGGITVNNMEGASGYPYANYDRDKIRDVLNRPKFKGRPTKGKVFPHALRVVAQWVKAGMPMSGPEYDAMAQPATLAYRGDRQVQLELRALASRGQDVAAHDAANQLAAILPSRSVIIVPTCAVLAQSTWAQPLGNYIAGAATPGFDWVDPDHSVTRLDQIRQLDLQQEGSGQTIATVGADASGWDRDVTGQMHAMETAWYMSMFPQNVKLLYVDAPLPMDVDSTWVQSAIADLSAGGTQEYEVAAILSDGSVKMQNVTAELLDFDYWEFICKVMTIINDAPIRWADYEFDAVGTPFNMGWAGQQFAKYNIVSNGGRRSGDGATGIGNTWDNLIVTPAAAKMSKHPKLAKLRARRAALQDTPVSGGYEVIDAFARGDDLALAIAVDGGVVPSEAVASGICSVGMRANAKKQEASDIPGKPVFGFANVIVTENYMGKLMGRTAQRFLVQESRGLNLETLDAVREVGNDTEISDLLIATTGTAKARLAPVAGFPLMSEHPLAAQLVEWAVHNDEYRLAYVVPDALVNGEITEEAREEIRRAADVEAKVQAKLRAKRENVSVDLERLKELYAGSTIHDLVEEYALVGDYVPTMAEQRVNNHDMFVEAVRRDKPLDL